MWTPPDDLPSAAGDPGYLASLRGGPPYSMLRQVRMVMAALASAPLLIVAMTPLLVRGGPGMFGPLPAWVYLPPSAAFCVALAAGLAVPAPLAAGLPPRKAARLAAGAFRSALMLRFALCEAVVLTGLVASLASHSERPVLLGFVLGYPLLLWLGLPTRGGVERIRRRLEAKGTPSHLWAVLLGPMPPA